MRPLEPRDESEIPTPHPNIFSLLVFGVNRTLSVGVYILAGSVAVYVAGPGIIVSLLVAGFFSMLSGFYFAEFGARVPRSGSVYLYSYVTMGQLYAFITGWTLILHFVLATAYLTRAWSYTFDSLIGNHISQVLEGTFSEHTPSFLAPYPDFVALALVLLMAGLLILGVHDSALVSKVSAGVNVLLLSFMILSGFIKGDLHNWQLTEQDYKLAASGSSDSYSLGPLGSGGFVPFGFEGILRGAALPFYSYFGLNAIITSGRETPNPQRSIPWSLGIIISICFLAYSGVSAALTLMVPYYQIHPYSPLPQAFHHVGWAPARYFVAVVILCVLFYSLLVVMLTMSRLICEMAEDGLLFRELGQIYARRGTPFVAVLVSATLSDILLSKGGSSSTLSGMLGQHVRQFGEKLVRRRPLEPSDESEIPTPHLNTLNLVLFGVNIPKARIYILAGAMAVHVAGPAIIISFLLVGLFAVLCAICFAEFGARVSCCGSVYLYSYVTMGQLYAFITGWTLILHLRVATAYLTRAWSYNFDSLIGNHISQKLEGTFSEHMPLFLAPYPDFVALALVLLMAGLLILGVQVTELVRKVATGFNVLVLSFVILSGFIKGDLHNWQLTEQDYKLATSGSPDSYSLGPLGSGGFVPFGFEGILQGAAMPFYTFLGLNAIVNKGKETTNPQRSIPSSLEIVISSCILTYSGVTAAHTLMVPYYQIHPYNPLPQAFHHVGWDPAGYFVAVVILCALFHSLLVVMLAMSRLICAMAEDGLLFRGLGQIYARRGTPLVAILVSATLSGILAVLLEIHHLVELLSVGVLLSYFLVTLSVLVLRYQPDQSFSQKAKAEEEIQLKHTAEESPLGSVPEAGTSNPLKSLWEPVSTTPTLKSGQMVYGCAFLLVLLLTILSLLLALWPSRVFSGDPGFTAGAVLLLLLIAGITAIIWRQPQNPSPLPFRVPALPVLSVLSIFVTVYLMMQLSSVTWAQFGIWNAIGLAIYFGYGIRHSPEFKSDPQQQRSVSRPWMNTPLVLNPLKHRK